MSLEYIRNYYGVPANEGQRVRYSGGFEPIDGTIIRSDSARLIVKLDGKKRPVSMHPTWQIEYLGDPNV